MSVFDGLGDELQDVPLVDDSQREPLRSTVLGEKPTSPFQGLADQVDLPDPLPATLTEASKKNPDTFAKAAKLARQQGVSPQIIEPSLEEFERQSKIAKINTVQMAKDFSVTAGFLSDYDNAAQFHDDIDTLTGLEKWIKNKVDYLGGRFNRGQAVVEIGELQSREVYNRLGIPGGVELTAEERERVERLNTSLKVAELDEQGQFFKMIGAATEQLPILGSMLNAGAKPLAEGLGVGAAAGATAALVAGQAGPQIAAPEEIVTVPAGAVTGGLLGLRTMIPVAKAATIKQILDVEVGNAFNEYSREKDADGNQMDPQVAAYAAGGYGVLAAALESFSLSKLGNVFSGPKDAFNRTIKNRIKTILKDKTTREKVVDLGKTWGDLIVTESVTEALQEGAQVVAGAFAKYADKDSFTQQDLNAVLDEIFSVETLEKMGHGALEGARASAVFGAAGVVTTVAVEGIRAETKTTGEQRKIDELAELVKGSKGIQRNPEAVREFLQQVTTEDDNVYLPAERVLEYLTENNIDPYTDPVFQPLAKQIDEAAALEGDVVIPIPDFVAGIAATDHLEGLRKHMRLSADSLAPSEMAQVKEHQSFVDQLLKEAEGEADIYAEAQSVYEQVREQLIDTGRANPQVAKLQAQIIPAYVTRLAKQTGRGVRELFDEMALTIQGPMADQQAQNAERAAALGVTLDQDGIEYKQGQIVTESENFKKWFGESKVVDESGAPLVVYHGTDSLVDFTQFATGPEGIHFGTSRQANSRLGMSDEVVRRAQKEGLANYQANRRVIPVFLNIRNPKRVKDPSSTGDWVAIVENAKAEGHDGIVYRNTVEDKGRGDSYVVFDPTQIKSVFNRGTFDPQDPNILNQPVLDTPDPQLSVLHSLSSDNLIFADQMGGLAVPSLAVVPDGQAMEGYGDITLIGTREMADPQQTPVFDADAYTTTFPRPEYPKVRSKEAMKVVNEFKPFIDKFDQTREHIDTIFDNAVNRADPAETIRRLEMANSAKAMFLAEQGIETEPVMRAKKLHFDFSDTKTMREYFATNPDVNMEGRGEEHKRLTDAVLKAIDEYFDKKAETRKFRDELRQTYREAYLDDQGFVMFGKIWQLFRDQRSLEEQEVDTGATREALDTALQGKEAQFKTWIEDKILSMYGEPFLKVGREKLPYTLESIVRVMTSGKRLAGAEDTMTFGEGKVRAVAAHRFRNLEEMRRLAKENILPPDQIEQAREEAKELMEEFRNKVVEHYGVTNYRGAVDVWGGLDASMRAIAKWAKDKTRTAATLSSALKREEFVNVPQSVLDLGVEAGQAMLKAPVPYFESKPQRAVKLNEFAGAVIPNNPDPRVVEILQKNAIPFREYGERHDEQARSAAVQMLRTELQAQGRNVLFQSQPTGVRARGLYDANANMIRLLEASDLSTFLHESAHFFLEMEKRFNPAGMQGVNDWFARNAATIAMEANKYLGQSGAVEQSGIEKSTIVETEFRGLKQKRTKVFVRKIDDQQYMPSVTIHDGRIEVTYNPQLPGAVKPSSMEGRVWINRKIDEALAPLGENVFFRSTNKKEDYEFLKNGEHRGSKNWRDDLEEGGLSVSASPEFPADFAYFVEGEVVGQGTDNEPILNISTAKPVSDLMTFKKARSIYDQKLKKVLKKNGLTDEQYRYAHADPLFVDADPSILEQSAFHGSPHTFDKFTLQKIGTGEGAQAYGWGLYFAGNKEVAQWYRQVLAKSTVKIDGKSVGTFDVFSSWKAGKSAKKLGITNPSELSAAESILQAFVRFGGDWTKVEESVAELTNFFRPTAEKVLKDIRDRVTVERKGRLYHVELAPKDDEWLLWDKPLSEQSDKVRAALENENVTPEQFTEENFPASVQIVGGEILNTEDGFKLRPDGSDKQFRLVWKDVMRLLGEAESGASIYQTLVRLAGRNRGKVGKIRYEEGISPQEAASKYLLSIGIPGIKYLDGTSRKDGEGNFNFVLFDDSLVEITAFEQSQQTPGTAPGPITEEMVLQFLIDGGTGDKAVDDAINRATHEQFARGFETYLMEGTAPSLDLREAFRAFARWLTDLYRKMKGDLQVNLDDEMRKVFDRLLATEDQIAAVEAANRFRPLFTDAAMVGMTQEEFAAYQAREQRATDKARETLQEKIFKELKRETEEWWQEEKAERAKVITEQLKRQPVYNAIEQLRTKNGEIKLDRAQVKEMLGVDRVPDQLRGMTLTGMQGVSPDDAAAFLGYDSGHQMLTEIMKARPIREVAAEQAETEMKVEHGDILNDGTLEREAQDAAHNEERGKQILVELKTLARAQNRPAIDRAAIKALAEENIGRLPLTRILPAKYRRAEIKAAQAAQSAMDAGDRAAALQHKLTQAMNFYLWRAATDARTRADKIVRFTRKYGKKSIREQIAKAGNGYMEQIDGILERFEFDRSVKKTQAERQAITEWAMERAEEGDNIQLTREVLDETLRKHYREIPFDTLLGVYDSIRNIDHVARFANKVKKDGEFLDFLEVKREVLQHLEKLPKKFQPKVADVVNTSLGQKARWAMAQMTKLPVMFTWLDGGRRAGLIHKLMAQPFTDAAAERLRIYREVGASVVDAIRNRSKADQKRHNTKIHIPEAVSDVNDGTFMGHQILSVALNTGNLSNLEKMLKGEGWVAPDAAMEEITVQNPQLQAVLSRMSDSDWTLVELIWEQIDKLYPMMAEVHKRTSGLELPKIEAVPFRVANPTQPDGRMIRGGYYPVKYDPNRGDRAEHNEQRQQAMIDSMFGPGGIFKPSSDTGAKIERTAFFAPIRFSLDVVPTHIDEVIQYITHYEAIQQVYKLTHDPDIKAAIRQRLGKDEFNQIRPWLNDIAKEGKESPAKQLWDPLLQRLRFGTTLGMMGFKVSTGLMQISGLSNSVGEVGIKHMVRSMRHVLGSLGDKKRTAEMWGFVTDRSRIMGDRIRTMDRELMNAMTTLRGKSGMLKAVQETSLKHIAYIQTYSVDLPTWYGAYYKGLDEAKAQLDAEDFDSFDAYSTAIEEQAIRRADWTVENVQGSGMTKDMARIVRNQTETGRMLTMFFTFFSSMWNMQRDTVRGARSGLYSPTTLAAKLLFLYMIPVAYEMALRGEMEDDDDETAAEKYLTRLALYPLQTVPVVRDIANAAGTGFDFQMTPVAGIIAKGIKSSTKAGGAMIDDEEISKANVKNISKAAGAYFGLPGVSQAWNTGEHLYQVLEEGDELTMQELLFGPKREN